MSTDKETLNKIASEYHEQDMMSDKFIEDLCQINTYNWVFENLKGAKSVLEMGFGEGNFTRAIVEQGYRPTLLDGSDILLEKAKNLHGDKIVAVHSLFEEYQPQNKFDCIVCTHVLEHVDSPATLLNRMRDWINECGKIIIIVPNKESIHRQLAVIMGLQPQLDTLGARDKLVGHQRVYSLETLSNEILDSGYEISESVGFFLKTLPNSMMLDYSQELIIALNKISQILPKNLLANIGIVAKKKNA